MVSEGSTLALTVGSPSAHRRYSALKHLTFMLLFLLGSLNVWGADVVAESSMSDIAEANSWTTASGNGTQPCYTSFNLDANITISTTGSANCGSYWGSDWRLYQAQSGNVIITAVTGCTLKSVTFTYTVKNTGTLKDGSTTISSGSAVSLSGTSKTFTVGNTGSATNGQVKITEISVTYITASGCTNSVNISKGTPSNGDFTLSKTGSQATCDGNVQVVVTPTPAEHYKVTGVSAPNSSNISGPDGEGKYTVTYAQNTNANSEINVTFALKDKYTVTWNNHGLTSTSQVYEGEKPVFPATPTSCDATSTTFVGWATENWTGKLADLAGKTVYTSAAAMPAVAGPVEYFAVYAKASAGDEEEHDGPSFSRSGSDDTYTTGYTFSAQAEGKTGYYQDGSGTLRYIQVLNATTPIFSETPNRVTVTAKIGGGTGNTDLTDPVQAQLLDNTGAPITGAVVAITSHITTNTGDTYAEIEIPITGVTSAYGVRISHQKQSGYNVRYYSFSLKYYTGGATYSDYMTTCAAAGTCEAPSFTPAAGTYDGAQDITLQTSTPSAHIYYTLDGTDPDDGSAEYSTTPIHITQNTTIKAITYAEGLTESSISEGVFNIRYAQPTFSPAGGAYNAVQNVTISAAEADAIYYTTNGEDPTVDPANLYDGSAIAINTTGTHIIKAIAVKAGYANSNVASATYVMDLPYANIAAFIAGAPTTAKSLTLNNAIITGVDGTTLYVQDETAGIMIYGLASLPDNAAPNHSISGTIVGKYSSYKNQHELVKPNNTTPIDISGVTISADEVARPAVSEYTTLADAYAAKPMMLVKLTGVKYEGVDSYYNATFGSSKIYNTFNVFNASTIWPETTHNCDITGIVIDFNGTLELLPVFASDIVADADAAAPVFTPAGGADAENAVQVDLNSYVAITAADAKHSVDVDQVQITSTDPVSVTAVSSRDFYRDNTVTKWYYGNSASASYDITIEGVTTQGNVVAQVGGVDAISAKENDEVHVLIIPNTHFELATITVNGSDPTVVTAGEEYSFTMPGAAVTIAVTWTEDAKYALTFTAGEGSGDAPAISGNEYYAGDVITLPANTFTYDAQHKFTKWLIGGVEYAAGVNYTMPAATTEAVAQWDEIPDFAHGDWILVEDVDELTEGSYVIIAAEEDDYAMIPYSSGNNCGRNDAVKDGKLLTYNAAFAIFEIKNFVQEEVVTGKSFLDVVSDKYLYSPSANNYLKTKEQQDAYAAWNIEISEGTLTAFNKGNTAYEIQYNTSGMFSCYKSTQQAISLYKYHVPSLKLSYDKNTTDDVTNLPGMQVADGENKVTVSSEVPLRENYIFNGWKDGESNDHAAGEVITLSANMTLYAQWRTPNTYSISYDANGGTLIEGKSDPTPASVTEGDAYTVEDNVYEVEGKLFIGWKANGVTYNAGQEIHPTEDMAFVAQWGDPTVTDFMLVTDVKQLKDGDKVYIVADGKYNVALGELSGNVRNPVEIAKSNAHIVNIGNDPVELTLGKDGNDYTFYDGANYLAWSSGNTLTNASSVSDNSTWNITINEGVTKIANKDDNTREIRYNSGSPRFAAYAGTQQHVSIYKRPDYSRGVTEGRFGTICLPKAGKMDGAAIYEVAYIDNSLNKIFFDEVMDGAMSAGMPYIFLPNAGIEKLGVYYSDNTAAPAPAGNYHGLYGSYTPQVLAQEAGNYILYNNQYMYVGASSSNVSVGANRAYFKIGVEGGIPTNAVAPLPGRRRISMSAVREIPTGLENGELINGENGVQKVLINGELFILRGEKMYNANGQLVK